MDDQGEQARARGSGAPDHGSPAEPADSRPVVRVRLAGPADAAAISEIYNHEVMHSTATFDLVPRSPEDQRNWLAQRRGAFAAIVGVADDDGVVGFASLSPYKERAAYRTTVEDSIYVRQDQQGRGVGKLLLSHLLDVAEASGFHAVMARIEASGRASRALHAACGFELIGIEREVGRKFNRWLSVAVMQRVLSAPGPARSPAANRIDARPGGAGGPAIRAVRE
jgi:L-amino acid N-acyltransferase